MLTAEKSLYQEKSKTQHDLKIFTGKKYQRLQKVQIWAFELLTQQINSL